MSTYNKNVDIVRFNPYNNNFVSIVIVRNLRVAVLLVGCGNQPETNTSSTDQPPTTESTSTTEATCEADCVKTFTCDCGDSYTEVITATGHNYGEKLSGLTKAQEVSQLNNVLIPYTI